MQAAALRPSCTCTRVDISLCFQRAVLVPERVKLQNWCRTITDSKTREHPLLVRLSWHALVPHGTRGQRGQRAPMKCVARCGSRDYQTPTYNSYFLASPLACSCHKPTCKCCGGPRRGASGGGRLWLEISRSACRNHSATVISETSAGWLDST